MYVWFSQMGFPHNTLEFPYKRQSPITKKNKEYDSVEIFEKVKIFCKTKNRFRKVVY